LGFKGPRKMTIIIPGMSSDHHRVEVQPRNVRIKISLFYFLLMIICSYSKDSESLIERWKRNDMSNLLELHNKTPVWNEGKSISSR